MSAEPVIPTVEDYRLFLDVDFRAGTWVGTNEFEVRPAPPMLDLHSVGLGIDGIRVDGMSVTVRPDPNAQRIRVPLATARVSARIGVRFHGAVEPPALIGLYRSRSGSDYVLTTQCAATGARRIFPCIDRPDRKARFSLTVDTDAEEEVIANTAATSITTVGGRRRWMFAPTPPMATYLFYLGIGRFERVRDRCGGTTISVVTRPGRSGSGGFSLGAAVRSLRFYERYYEIPYPLPKLDLIALEELSWGGMENWGAITFREMQLLVDARTGAVDRRRVFSTVAHEIAHQWFGDLVTMRWWDDVWLNESFATLMGYEAVDRLDPSQGGWDEFRATQTARGLSSDALASAPAVAPANNPSEATGEVYDPAITYGKGASVLRMLETYLGEETFRRGVVLYLKTHAHGNARTADLWASLSQASGEPIADITGPWIERPGHPVIEVRRGSDGLELAQRRFRFDRSGAAAVWPIPLRIRRGAGVEQCRFDTERTTIPGSMDGVIHLNPDASGFYRVRYDDELYDRLARSFSRLVAADRWSVLSDLGAFVISGDVPFERYARFVHLTNDLTDVPLADLVQSSVAGLAEWAPDVPLITDLARSVLALRFQQIGVKAMPGEEVRTRVLREHVADSRVRVDGLFAREVAELFVEWDRIDPELRGAAAIGRARTDPRLASSELRHRLAQHPPDGEALRIIEGLAWVADPAEVVRLLDDALTGGINRGHAPRAVTEAARNPVARDATWRWLSRHAEELDVAFRGSLFLSETLRLAIPRLGLVHPEPVRTYFSEHSYRFPEGKRGIGQGLEMLTIVESFRRRMGASVPLTLS